jgi:ABC-2 type transport system permease protein
MGRAGVGAAGFTIDGRAWPGKERMSAVFALAMKDLRLLSRDRANCFFTFVFPLAVALFFGYIFGGGGGGGSSKMDIAVVDLDRSDASKRFVADLSNDSALAVRELQSRDEGNAVVRKGDVVACVVVPEGFGEGSMFSGGGGLKLEAVVDPARKAEAGLLQGKLNEIGFKQMSRMFAEPEMMDKNLDVARRDIAKADGLKPAEKLAFGLFFDAVSNLSKSGAMRDDAPATDPNEPAAAGDKATDADGGAMGGWRPVDITMTELAREDKHVVSSFEMSFPQGVVWGLMGAVMAFAASVADERTRGTLTRLTTAPVTMGHILAGKALACFITCVFVQAMLLGFGVVVMGVRVMHPLMMVLAVLVASVGFTGIMMIIAGLARTVGAAQGYARAIVLVLAMIGGGTIPVMFMPPFLKVVSGVSPFKWVVEAVEMAMWRATSVQDMLVPMAVLLGVGLLGYAVGTIAVQRQAQG